MAAQLPRRVAEWAKPTRFRFVPYRKTRDRLRLANLLDATYRGSLDCPELNGVRSAARSLEAHELSGEFSASMWRIYQLDGADVGALLFVDRPERRAWEIVYLGVIESVRRRGLARTMLLEGLRDARRDGAEQVLVVVDGRNDPALKLYESLGFAEYARKVAHARIRIAAG